jgi:hypothetical protein
MLIKSRHTCHAVYTGSYSSFHGALEQDLTFIPLVTVFREVCFYPREVSSRRDSCTKSIAPQELSTVSDNANDIPCFTFVALRSDFTSPAQGSDD